MRQISPPKPKFEGSLKHYHRQSGAQRRIGWEEWAEANPNRRRYPWGKILVLVFSLLLLASIIVGLAIELAPE